eukprot:COSAG02_NODE_1168_length_14134_cov_19.590310_8_plen_240_part_00
MAVKRPTAQTGGPPAKRAYAGGGTAENVARMLGIVGVEGSPSSTVSFGRAGFAAHMDRVGLQVIAQDLLQAAQQRPRSHLASPSSDVPAVEEAGRRQLEALTGAGIKTEGDACAAPSASVGQEVGASLRASTSPQPSMVGGASASSAGVGAYAARERAVVDCFVAIVQQAAASCTQSQPQLQHQHQHQQASTQYGASAMSTLAAVGGTAAATSDMHDSAPVSAAPAALGPVEIGGSEGR